MSLLQPIKQKSLNWIHESSKKFFRQIEKLKIYYNGGYKKIQPRILGRGVLTMIPPSIVESEEENCKEHFVPCLSTRRRRHVINIDNKPLNVKLKNFENEIPQKDVVSCQIVSHEGKVFDHAYDVHFERITPSMKLKHLRRQSTAPEFI